MWKWLGYILLIGLTILLGATFGQSRTPWNPDAPFQLSFRTGGDVGIFHNYSFSPAVGFIGGMGYFRDIKPFLKVGGYASFHFQRIFIISAVQEAYMLYESLNLQIPLLARFYIPLKHWQPFISLGLMPEISFYPTIQIPEDDIYEANAIRNPLTMAGVGEIGVYKVTEYGLLAWTASYHWNWVSTFKRSAFDAYMPVMSLSLAFEYHFNRFPLPKPKPKPPKPVQPPQVSKPTQEPERPIAKPIQEDPIEPPPPSVEPMVTESEPFDPSPFMPDPRAPESGWVLYSEALVFKNTDELDRASQDIVASWCDIAKQLDVSQVQITYFFVNGTVYQAYDRVEEISRVFTSCGLPAESNLEVKVITSVYPYEKNTMNESGSDNLEDHVMYGAVEIVLKKIV